MLFDESGLELADEYGLFVSDRLRAEHEHICIKMDQHHLVDDWVAVRCQARS